MSTTDQLLNEFIDAWNAGRRPRVRDYLARLPDGPERNGLAKQLSSWLEVAPTPDYDDATREAIAGEPALARVFAAADADAGLWPSVVPQLRARAGLSLSELAGRLLERLSLDRQNTERTAGYLDRLERGALDPTRVSRRLTVALANILGIGDRTFADTAIYSRAFRAQPAAAGGALFRATPAAAPAQLEEDFGVLARAARTPAPPPLDEIDRLFTGGPDA